MKRCQLHPSVICPALFPVPLGREVCPREFTSCCRGRSSRSNRRRMPCSAWMEARPGRGAPSPKPRGAGWVGQLVHALFRATVSCRGCRFPLLLHLGRAGGCGRALVRRHQPGHLRWLSSAADASRLPDASPNGAVSRGLRHFGAGGQSALLGGQPPDPSSADGSARRSAHFRKMAAGGRTPDG